jgi:hypothetical protein
MESSTLPRARFTRSSPRAAPGPSVSVSRRRASGLWAPAAAAAAARRSPHRRLALVGQAGAGQRPWMTGLTLPTWAQPRLLRSGLPGQWEQGLRLRAQAATPALAATPLSAPSSLAMPAGQAQGETLDARQAADQARGRSRQAAQAPRGQGAQAHLLSVARAADRASAAPRPPAARAAAEELAVEQQEPPASRGLAATEERAAGRAAGLRLETGQTQEVLRSSSTAVRRLAGLPEQEQAAALALQVLHRLTASAMAAAAAALTRPGPAALVALAALVAAQGPGAGRRSRARRAATAGSAAAARFGF